MTTQYRFHIAVMGSLPRDHGYIFLSALSKIVPSLHNRSDIQITPIPGRKDQGLIWPELDAVFHIRGINETEAHMLAGRCFRVGDTLCAIEGNTYPVPFVLGERLRCRSFVFDPSKCEGEPPSLRNNPEGIEKVFRQISGIGDHVTVTVGKYKTNAFKGMTFIGHALELNNVDPETSLRIQSTGVGRLTSMGCGVFHPVR